MRKRIAILSSQLEENYQANFMQGFLAKAFAFDYDVCTFATYRKDQDTSEREVGETSIFSLIDYDAFDGVVVLPETLQTPGLMLTLEQDFREIIGNRIEKIANVEYAFQELDALPEGYHVTEGRKKPWGTGQAVLTVKNMVHEPFLVINADDYYGREGFFKIHDYMVNEMNTDGDP